jgi:Carboxypeptidase regulatory-like domain
MSRDFLRGSFCCLVAMFTILVGFGARPALAQSGSTGTVVITVLDPDGKVVPGAQLALQDLSTNDVRNGATQDKGTYTFVNLSLGTYKLTVTKTGFQTQIFDTVAVHAAEVTDVNASLLVGVTTETVEVHESETPLIDTTSNAIGTNIDIKQIEDLPLGGRNIGGLTTLVPGTESVAGVGPTWNGLPAMAQGSNLDGVIGTTNRMKFEGNSSVPDAQPRLEDIAEMTVQTAQLDLSQGNGQSAMMVNYVTRRGSNSFHGRVFEDFQNSYLNANSWSNDAIPANGVSGPPIAKQHFELNDFGGSVGGPIIKNKLFFFGTYAENKSPGSSLFTNSVLTSSAQAGVFTTQAGTTVCLFTATCPGGGVGLVDQYNAANETNFPTTVNPVIAAEQNNINTAAVPLGTVSISSNRDPNISNFQFSAPNPTTFYFPTVRVDYNMSQSLRFNVAWNMTKENQPSAFAATFPGTPFDGQGTGSTFKYYTAALGVDWTIRPTVVNQFRGGFLYHFDGFGTVGFDNIETQYPTVAWNYPGVPYPQGGTMSGQQYSLPTPDYYPVFNFSDTVTWQKGAHTINFGGNWYREQDHYWNAPAGYDNFNLGIVNGDPALNMFSGSSGGSIPGGTNDDLSRVEQLYAILAGRVSGVNGQFPVDLKTGTYATVCCSAYNLDELSWAGGLFIQDSYRVKSNLTVNFGLGWNFTSPQRDLTNAYHSVPVESLYGPSGVGNLFNPGSLQGTNNPVYQANGRPYNGWYKTPQPTIGIAWSPQYTDGILGKLTGSGATVIRAGFSIKNSVEPYQYFWDYATDQGSFYYNNFTYNPSPTPGTGFFAPGSIALTGTGASATNLPSDTFLYTPSTTYQGTFPMSSTTFTGFPAFGMNPNIKQPYTESWNLGFQRQLGKNNALEVRYVGNRVVHQWIGLNLNEVNTLAAKAGDPSFLSQFKQAQTNLSINTANGYTGQSGAPPQNFADLGFAGEGPTPVFDAAFAGEGTSSSLGVLADYTNGGFIRNLNYGQAGSLAASLDNPFGTTDYFCNLVGSGFGPCSSTVQGGQGYTGPGAGYPINYFQANPYNAGGSVNYLTNGGYSTYNGLQVDFRQKQWHGMQFDANYTWAHNLGLSTRNDWEGGLDNGYGLRNLHESYGPTLYDIRHTINVNGTYDLPFGKGKQYLNRNNLLDHVVGGWTVATILTYRSGAPITLYGGNHTYNDYSDGGVTLTGLTRSQLQGAIGITNLGYGDVALINPASVSGWQSSGALAANTTAGVIAAPIYLYGPHFFNDDIAITKSIAIRENIHFSLQGEFLNAFNHPNFGNYGGYSMDSGVQDGAGFGTTFGALPGARTIELRANLSF